MGQGQVDALHFPAGNVDIQVSWKGKHGDGAGFFVEGDKDDAIGAATLRPVYVVTQQQNIDHAIRLAEGRNVGGDSGGGRCHGEIKCSKGR